MDQALRARLEAAPPKERRALLVAAMRGEGPWPGDDVPFDEWPGTRRELSLRFHVHVNEVAEGATPNSLADVLLSEQGLGPPLNRQPRWSLGSPLGEPVGEPLERPVIFLLAVPRSGSTLMRVMLAGHSRLFSPPELLLLPFARMGLRLELLRACGYDWGRMGTRQALEELGEPQPDALLDDWEERDAGLGEVFGYLQERCAPRILLDKTPANMASLDWLKQAERLFARPRYVHLVRHPGAVMESFQRMRFQGLLGANFGIWDDDPALFASEVWAAWNENVLQFRALIGDERIRLVHYEDLVRDPHKTMTEVCRFLDLEVEEAVLDPYAAGRVGKADSGGNPKIGDWNLNTHGGIDPSQADKWKQGGGALRLTERARRVADELGYKI